MGHHRVPGGPVRTRGVRQWRTPRTGGEWVQLVDDRVASQPPPSSITYPAQPVLRQRDLQALQIDAPPGTSGASSVDRWRRFRALASNRLDGRCRGGHQHLVRRSRPRRCLWACRDGSWAFRLSCFVVQLAAAVGGWRHRRRPTRLRLPSYCTIGRDSTSAVAWMSA
jgi:hypothetical protein